MTLCRLIVVAFFASLLCGCGASSVRPGSAVRVDEVPMYGGMDRISNPAVKAADDKFIADASKEFGGRERTSQVWVEQGFAFYKRDENGMAMRRFNQAWLLNPNEPGVYHGFSAVLYDRGDNCGAMLMAERGLALGLSTPDFQADSALLFSLCADDPKKPADREKSALLRRSDELFAAASRSSATSIYVFDKWSQALYWRGDYAGAWAKIAQMRAAGGVPSEQVLRALRSKMPEPK